jgi:hypothetical protein
MVAAHPDKSFGQLGKLLGAAWTDADEDTKSTYRKLHQVAVPARLLFTDYSTSILLAMLFLM